jgi:hypothetical protein
LAIVASKACMAVAIINPTAAFRRIELDRVMAAALIRSVIGQFVLKRRKPPTMANADAANLAKLCRSCQP